MLRGFKELFPCIVSTPSCAVAFAMIVKQRRQINSIQHSNNYALKTRPELINPPAMSVVIIIIEAVVFGND